MKLIIILAALAVAGCASSDGNLQRATAMSIGGSTPAERVQVSDIRRGVTDVAWTATADGKQYSCSADDMMRRPLCLRR